jgi:hypothetical protein
MEYAQKPLERTVKRGRSCNQEVAVARHVRLPVGRVVVAVRPEPVVGMVRQSASFVHAQVGLNEHVVLALQDKQFSLFSLQLTQRLEK